MTKTYFILSRKIFESAIWRDDPHILKLFIYLVGMARHYNKPQSYPTFKIKRGELVTSLRNISDDNEYFNKTVRKWSSGKVSRMLHKLQEQGYINILADTYGTHLKICNYDTYQTTTNYGANSSGTEANSSGTVVETNNNDNNGKNVNNVNIAFEKFWNLYDNKQAMADCEAYWNGDKPLKNKKCINNKDRELCIKKLPAYVKNTYKDGTYPTRKHPKTYLYNRSWNDEVIKKSGPEEFDNSVGSMG